MDSQPAFSSKDTDNTASSLPATEESSSSLEYAIFPVDNFKTDSILALLASYPNANVQEHVSVSGWGIMYWDATLSPVQYQEVAAHKQVRCYPWDKQTTIYI
jgi:hypothetical protein